MSLDSPVLGNQTIIFHYNNYRKDERHGQSLQLNRFSQDRQPDRIHEHRRKIKRKWNQL